METFTLSRKELHRPGLLKALCGGRLTNAERNALMLPAHFPEPFGAYVDATGKGFSLRWPT